jgi:hypothetical protein
MTELTDLPLNLSHPLLRALHLLSRMSGKLGAHDNSSPEVQVHAGGEILKAAGLEDSELEMFVCASTIDRLIILGEAEDEAISEVQEAIMCGIMLGYIAAHLALEPEA